MSKVKEKEKKEKSFKTIKEFEKKYFPKLSKEQDMASHDNARDIGISLAKEVLAVIKRQLSK